MNIDQAPANAGPELEARSPLGAKPGAAAVVVVESARLKIEEEAFLPLASFRLSRKADASTLATQLPLAPADAPNRFSGDDTLSLGWFEPRAWMLIGRAPASPPVIANCLHTDLSARLAVFRLRGADAETILAAATSVVPGERGFVRTFFAETFAVLIQRLAADDFRLLVDVSLARAAADWLADAARLAAPH